MNWNKTMLHKPIHWSLKCIQCSPYSWSVMQSRMNIDAGEKQGSAGLHLISALESMFSLKLNQSSSLKAFRNTRLFCARALCSHGWSQEKNSGSIFIQGWISFIFNKKTSLDAWPLKINLTLLNKYKNKKTK